MHLQVPGSCGYNDVFCSFFFHVFFHVFPIHHIRGSISLLRYFDSLSPWQPSNTHWRNCLHPEMYLKNFSTKNVCLTQTMKTIKKHNMLIVYPMLTIYKVINYPSGFQWISRFISGCWLLTEVVQRAKKFFFSKKT